MNRTVLTLLLALSPLALHAQSPAPTDPSLENARPATATPATDAGIAPGTEGATERGTATEAVAEAATSTETEAEPVADAAHDRRCLRDTGTRIQRRDRAGCNHAIGESYTGEELRRTGATTTAEALRLLSPRFGG